MSAKTGPAQFHVQNGELSGDNCMQICPLCLASVNDQSQSGLCIELKSDGSNSNQFSTSGLCADRIEQKQNIEVVKKKQPKGI